MRYDDDDFRRVTYIYDMAYLNRLERNAIEDIHRINKLIDAVRQQKKVVENTAFKRVVAIEQRRRYDGGIAYVVCLKIIPDVPNVGQTYYEEEHHAFFSSKDKKAAYEYAQKLALEHNAEVVEEKKSRNGLV